MVALSAVLLSCSASADGAEPTRDDAAAAMKRAAMFYRTKVASHGGYVYHYSLDLAQRWGEGKASVDQVWVQRPGTPAVGLAYLAAYRATGDVFYRDAAVDAARALVYGQLRSGGWTNSIDFDPQGTLVAGYRNGRGKRKEPGNSTLDDGISQGALELLIRVDQWQEFKDREIHDAAHIALEALLAAQLANGAFSQVWTGPAEKGSANDTSVGHAKYPTYDWRTEGRVKAYWTMPTLNDGLAGEVAATLLTARDVYRDERALAAVRRLGEFLIAAQMPEPQPAWAQQYDLEMHPIWARKFEPPAISGRESQDAIRTLLTVAAATGDKKFLAPIPKALAYLRRSQLNDGRLARFYELQTNKPLYMTIDYKLTHDDSDVPPHYGWKTDSELDELQAAYEAALADKPTTETSTTVPPAQVAEIISKLDTEGRWIETYAGERLVGQPKLKPGLQYFSSAAFCRNVELLSRYVEQLKSAASR